MRVKILGLFGNILEQWDTSTPLLDLVSREKLKFYTKRFKLDGAIVPGEALLKMALPGNRKVLEVYLIPQGPLFTPAGLILLGLTVVTGLIRFLFFKPQGNQRDADEDRSPVNRYSGRLNVSRPQSRVPEIYGTHRIYPDLIAPEYWFYVGRSQRIHYLMCIGVGEYQINDIRLGDTPIGLTTGVTVNVYGPGQPAGDFVYIARNVDNLRSTELRFNEYTQYYTLRGDKQIDIWFDLEFPNGLAAIVSNTGETVALDAQVEVQIINEAGSYNRTFIYNVGSASKQPFIFTVTASGYLGGPLPPDIYRVRFRNSFDSEASAGPGFQVLNEMNLTRVAGVESVETVIYPKTTVCTVTIDTSNFNQDQLNKRINFLVTRKLRTWDGEGMTPGIAATQRMADALVDAATGEDSGNYDDSQLDLPGLYSIQSQLEALGEGTFNAVIDQRQSVDTELQVIANSGRVSIYRYGNRLYFVRDQLKSFPNALFNGRNKLDAEDIVFNFRNSDDPDSVEITWIDPALDYRPNQVLYPPDAPQLNVERIDLIGCTLETMATRRAIYEYLVKTVRRDSLKMRVTEEGRLLALLDWVQVSDGIQELAGDGECDIQLNVVTLDRNLPVEVGNLICIRTPTGDNVGAYSITEVLTNRQVRVTPQPNLDPLPDNAQVRYLYAVKNQSADLSDWLVTSVKPDGDQRGWVVEAVPYIPEIYDVDVENISTSFVFGGS